MKKPRLTVGIPAYNEAENIAHLLRALLDQKLSSAELSQIIVVSDASTDQTVKLIRKVSDQRIMVIENSQRLGKVGSLHKIIQHASGDVLVLVDGDTLPKTTDTLELLTQPIFRDAKIGVVGANTVSASPHNFIEHVVADSHDLKKSMYGQLNKGQNLYLCHGRMHAISKALYSKITWPENCPEDAFSYLYCTQNGYKFAYAPKAVAIFRSPSTLKDYFLQSQRFLSGRKELEKYFSTEFILTSYVIPKKTILKSLFLATLKKPITTISYLFLIASLRLFKQTSQTYQQKWPVSYTSKKVVV